MINLFTARLEVVLSVYGSKYYRTGVNFAGPAPKPLAHFEMSVDHSGRLVVDRGKTVPTETELIV